MDFIIFTIVKNVEKDKGRISSFLYCVCLYELHVYWMPLESLPTTGSPPINWHCNPIRHTNVTV